MIKNIDDLIESVKKEIKEELDIAVIGLSGGVDSMVCAALCTLALGKDNVYAVHMPYGDLDLTPDRFNGNSMKVAKKLGINSKTVPIKKAVDTFNDSLGFSMSILNRGNSRSRIRMATLYAFSHDLQDKSAGRVRVIGTGNLSEDFIGYDTKGGDNTADIFIIGDLLKSEVYQLAEYFAKNSIIESEMIDYNPSAGLWEGQSDEDEIGYKYIEMEPSVLKLRESIEREELSDIDKFVLDRHLKNKHKHSLPRVLELRNFCD